MGAASVLLQKRPAQLETVGDVDGRVVNAFRILRDRPEDLVRAIRLTPWAEDEYELSRFAAADPLEDARRFWFTCWMSIHGGPNPGRQSSFRYQRSIASRFRTPPLDAIKVDHLYVAATRLKNVQILKRDAFATINAFSDESGCLLYFDPPYLKATRTQARGYNHEVDDDWHRQAADALHRARGMVLISGYQSALYQQLYEARGWKRVDRRAQTNSGSFRVESLWLSPQAWQALNCAERELPLFASNGGEP
jgi:DNA adenine methylase